MGGKHKCRLNRVGLWVFRRICGYKTRAEVMAYGNVGKPRQKAAGLSHIPTGPIEFLFRLKINGKNKRQKDNLSAMF